VLCAAMLVLGVLRLPLAGHHAGTELSWQDYDEATVSAAIASGQPVIVDFGAKWCAPCRELEERTFTEPQVKQILEGYARFKVDQTKSNPVADGAAQRFEVVGVPTVIIIRDGVEVSRLNAFEVPELFLKRLQ